MAIYRRDAIAPEWEPAPWPMAADAADAQERGFHRRATTPIVWQRLPWKTFPPEGIFGEQEDWFRAADVEFFASFGGEDLLLIQNCWFGWPDPPEWGLASRPGGEGVDWARWGHFRDLPTSWEMPNETTPEMNANVRA
ncbi:hypothetical protein [Sphingomonas sp. ERG5]|uniref:hypothetical protein n=1 Tax=Sphingomonas sp. ERG5 TaxID=1381597 RepID=UPI00054BF03A|nr:hypothetical protein [Sphingomonas sp. ERG5]